MAGPRAQDGGARGGGGRHLSEVATGPSVTAALLDAAIGGSGRWRRRRRSCPLRCGLCAVDTLHPRVPEYQYVAIGLNSILDVMLKSKVPTLNLLPVVMER
ncbi:uncharacterized protein LOC144604138 isoform X2 [Rhinoraja longicauda]